MLLLLLAGNLTTATAQDSSYLDTAKPDKGPDPREDLRAEAELPYVEPDARRAIIRSDKTLLNAPDLAVPSIYSLKAELEASRAELEKTKQMIGEIIKQNRDVAEHRALPPLKDAVVKVFDLTNIPAEDAARQLDALFGPAPIRTAVEERTNSLIVFGQAEALSVVEALLLKLDANPREEPSSKPPGEPTPSQRRSLLLRVFWLADGLPDGEGTSTEDILPVEVTNAVVRLGLQSPLLVTQTMNSISVEEGAPPVKFSTSIPAILLKNQVSLSCEGTMAATTDNRANVEMRIVVGAMDCVLTGSLATPLGHFMVLGTANSIIPDNGAGGFGMAPMEHSEGMPMGRGMEGGRGIGGFGSEGRVMGDQTPAKFNTSRFAFVVQVIEGESFAPEK